MDDLRNTLLEFVKNHPEYKKLMPKRVITANVKFNAFTTLVVDTLK